MNTNNELLRAAKALCEEADGEICTQDDCGCHLSVAWRSLQAAIAAAEQAQPDHKDAVMRERYPLLQDDVAATRMALHKAIRDLTDGPASDDLSNEELVGVPFNAAKLAEQAQPSEPAPVDFAAQVAEMTSKFRNWMECEAGEIDGQEHEVAIDYNAMLYQLWVLHDLAKQRKGGAS